MANLHVHTIALMLLTSFSVAFLILPMLSRVAVRIGLLDHPEERKVHLIPKPLVGGIGMAIAFFICSLLFIPHSSFGGLYAGILLLIIVGFFDDYKEFTHRWKFLAQIFAAILMMHLSKTFLFSLGNLFSFGEVRLGVLAIPVTIFCTVGVVNAINMADGLDGLAGGISLLALISFAGVSVMDNHPDLLFLSLALIGALIGFLKYNWHPSKLFMGDAGSLVLGFFLAFFSIKLTQDEGSHISPMFPLLVLAVPIVDTVIVMTKRVLRNKSPFYADKNHLHHLLMRRGYSHAATVKIMLSLSALLSLFAIYATAAALPDHVMFLAFAAYCAVHSAGSFYLEFAAAGAAAPAITSAAQMRRPRGARISMVIDYMRNTLLISSSQRGGVAMKRITLMALMVVFGMFLFQSIAFPATDDAVKNLAATMKSALDSGKGARDVVKDALQAGNTPPDVFAAACRIGISLEDAVYGAIAAGISRDVIARSATGVCGTAAEVARILGDADEAFAYGGGAGGIGFAPFGGSGPRVSSGITVSGSTPGTVSPSAP